MGALIEDEDMKNITYENFHDHLCCDKAQSDDVKSRNLKVHRCLSNWNVKHCFVHKKTKADCEGLFLRNI